MDSATTSGSRSESQVMPISVSMPKRMVGGAITVLQPELRCHVAPLKTYSRNVQQVARERNEEKEQS